MRNFSNPFLWLSQPIGGTPKPWRYFKIDGLLVNAYEILSGAGINRRVREKKIGKYLGFDGPVMMDSGGYLFLKKNTIGVSPEHLMWLYEETKPNVAVVLDHPIDSNLSAYQISKRKKTTLDNTRRMVNVRYSKNPELVPVIHGLTPGSIGNYIKRLNEIAEFRLFGVGSLVQSVFNVKGVSGMTNALRIVLESRRRLSNEWLHVFGVGSVVTMCLMFLAGVDSVDSSAWRTKAAFGAIQLPGIGDRYITGKAGLLTNKVYKGLSQHDQRLLDDCGCPICATEGLTLLKKSFTARALHNAWVFQQEIEAIRKMKKTGEFVEYAKKIIIESRFRRSIEIIEKKGMLPPS